MPSAFVSGDPIQIINAVLQIASSSLQTTQQLGKSFLQKLGILKPDSTGITNGQIPVVYGSDGRRVRHQARYVADRGAVLVGRQTPTAPPTVSTTARAPSGSTAPV